MPFIPSIWGDTEESLAFKRADARTIYIEIGYEEDGTATYFLNVELYPSDEGNEFTFSLAEVRDGAWDTIFDSYLAGQIINSPSYKRRIRKLLMRMSEDLIRSCNFDHFYMTTFCEHLPERALTKYRELCEIFQRCGYTVSETSEAEGCYLWIMNRSPAHIVCD